MKKLTSLLLAACAALCLAASASAEPLTIRVGGAPAAPPTFPVLRMMDANLLGDDIKIELDTWNSPEQLIAMVQGGKHDLFAFPLNVAAKLYNKGLPVRLANVNTWGVVYLMTSDPNVRDWPDLRGKTLHIALQSSPPDVVARYFLKRAGLDPQKDLNIVYVSNTELGPLAASGKAEHCIMIEPQGTAAMLQNPALRRVFSFTDQWKRFVGGDLRYPNAGFGGMARFYAEHPAEAEAFEKAYGESVAWVNEHPAEAAALAEKHLGLKAPMVAKSIPFMGLEYRRAVDAEAELDKFYRVLFDFDPQTVGGKVPDKGLLYAGPGGAAD